MYMEAFVLYPGDENQLNQVLDFIASNKINANLLDNDEQKKLAGLLLANLAKKNPKAYATMDEIISAVEEVRSEEYYGKKDNNS